jgi:HJR/Mrr/RecB family endonuclease
MAKRRRATAELRDLIARALVLLFFLAYVPVINWWNSIPASGRTFMLVSITIALLAAIGAVIMFSIYRKRERAHAWRRAMTGWQNNAQGNAFAQRQSAVAMSDIELEKFAAQVYKKMGYRVQHVGETGDHGVDVMLINPKNQKEVVQCKQWNKPIGEPVIRDLYGTMAHERAACGWLWAPRGFSEPAKRWAKGKGIELVDDKEIGRLVELVFGKSN